VCVTCDEVVCCPLVSALGTTVTAVVSAVVCTHVVMSAVIHVHLVLGEKGLQSRNQVIVVTVLA
jgi:hypothetical protein